MEQGDSVVELDITQFNMGTSRVLTLSSIDIRDISQEVFINLFVSMENASLDRFFHMSYIRNINKFYIGKKKLVVKPTNGLVYPYITTAATEK